MTTFISRDNEHYDDVVCAFNVEYYLKENRARRTTNLSLALNGFWAGTDMKLHERYMSFLGHKRCPLLQEVNNKPPRLLLTLKGVVNEQLLLTTSKQL